jgi:hypothetical protein
VGGHARRSVGTAWQIGFGNSEFRNLFSISNARINTDAFPVGGIIATFSFLAKDAPTYKPGFSIGLGFICLSVLASFIYFFAIIAENRRRDRGEVEGADLPEHEKLLMGDLNPNYRYML